LKCNHNYYYPRLLNYVIIIILNDSRRECREVVVWNGLKKFRELRFIYESQEFDPDPEKAITFRKAF
jgi:hypothetical protein